MDIPEKIQLFQDVAAGKKHPSALKAELPDAPGPDGEKELNWIGLAVDHVVAQRLQQAAANTQRIRFKIVEMVKRDETEIVKTEVVDLDGSKRSVKAEVPKMVEKTEFTDWYPEHSQFTAPMMMGQLRQKFRNAVISVDRG